MIRHGMIGNESIFRKGRIMKLLVIHIRDYDIVYVLRMWEPLPRKAVNKEDARVFVTTFVDLPVLLVL